MFIHEYMCAVTLHMQKLDPCHEAHMDGLLSNHYMNQLKKVVADVFLEANGLVMVRSDWYMVCCVV